MKLRPTTVPAIRPRLPPFIAAPHFASTRAPPPADRTFQSLLLPTGHRIAYAEYGPSDGLPLFYLHGFPSSRLECGSIAEIAEKKGVRLICPDRPGFGHSSLRPEHTGTDASDQKQPELPRIIDHPKTILALADHLALPRFSIMGCSGGGPFALACAAALPSDRMAAVGLVASGGPWVDSRPSPPLDTSIRSTKIVNAAELQRDVMLGPYLFSSAVYRAPATTTWVLDRIVGGLKRLVQTQAAQRRIDAWMAAQRAKAHEGKVEPESKEQIAEGREKVVGTVFEAFRQGAEGTVHEARLLSADWDVELGGIPAGLGVKIWHGTKDVNAPIKQIRYLAQRIPGAVLTEYDANHFGVAAHIGDIMEELTDPLAVR